MREITYRQAIREALAEEMERDERVFLLGEDVGRFGGAFGVSKGLYERFGARRVIDTPLSEIAIIGAAIGAAVTGLRPVAEIMFMDFTAVCVDQIINQAAKLRYMFGGKATVPMVIRVMVGTLRGMAAQHSQSLESWFMHIPGLKMVMPATSYDAKGLLKSAIRDDNPVMFIEHNQLYNTKGEVPDKEYFVPIGMADVKRVGKDITIAAIGRMVILALRASEILAARGVEVEVVDLRSLNPIDIDKLIASVKKTSRLITVEEGHKNVGVGAELCARVVEAAFNHLKVPVVRVAADDIPVPFNKTMESAVFPQVDDIIEAVESVLGLGEGENQIPDRYPYVY